MKLANPGPLGLLSFTIATLPDENPEENAGPTQAAFGLITFIGRTAQFIAGIMEFRVGNTFERRFTVPTALFGSVLLCVCSRTWASSRNMAGRRLEHTHSPLVST
ncbi:hypothetical protein N7509_007547 [Penicillium cosmopolitanum]|uniref:Uncharacterized protein n=1 Tax=Penicillium cosmopolitanum TaxID=1131564 RepID=A0A9W9VZB7_9EURO|nr:uncharacterized protein N7509_007547 [Penicillium cosmopolitanum]KAJ5392057.1 hypothetical protein N7509_007547 [Penicillium cosmopolitanum]